MGQSTLVDGELEDGRRFLQRFAAEGQAIDAAFWLKEDASRPWELFIAVEGGPSAPNSTYDAARRALCRLGETWVSRGDVRFIEPDDSAAQEAKSLVAKYGTGRLPLQHAGPSLGGFDVEQAFIYPPVHFTRTEVEEMNPEDVGREILRNMTAGGQSARVTLRDGTSFSGRPFGLQLGPHKSVIAQFSADGEPTPRVVRVDEIAAIA